MVYFKIGTHDYSSITSGLSIDDNSTYVAQQNAAGNKVVDYINSKVKIKVKIIALDDTTMKNLLSDIKNFNVQISYLNPKTKQLRTNVSCIIDKNNVEYYTIQQGKVMFKALSLDFEEL